MRTAVLIVANHTWINRHDNCLITGPTGVGKTYLACALATKACREGYRVTYERTSRLLESLAVARVEGRYGRRLAAIAKYELLVLDDWGLAPLTLEQCRDLLEIFEDRYDRRSTLVTSQLPEGRGKKCRYLCFFRADTLKPVDMTHLYLPWINIKRQFLCPLDRCRFGF